MVWEEISRVALQSMQGFFLWIMSLLRVDRVSPQKKKFIIESYVASTQVFILLIL